MEQAEQFMKMSTAKLTKVRRCNEDLNTHSLPAPGLSEQMPTCMPGRLRELVCVATPVSCMESALLFAAQATDPEEEKLRIKMRAAKRKMKGVNLQYVSDRRVFFDDVAGIGEAKVRASCCRFRFCSLSSVMSAHTYRSRAAGPLDTRNSAAHLSCRAAAATISLQTGMSNLPLNRATQKLTS